MRSCSISGPLLFRRQPWQQLSPRFDTMYATSGRPSIPPEHPGPAQEAAITNPEAASVTSRKVV